MDLKTKANNIALVINANKENSNPIQELEQIQKILISQYKTFVATIIHDRDILENGELKTIHLHAYIELPEKETLKSVLTRISTLLDISTDLISIEPTNNDYLIVQYLTHKNDKEKTQYRLEEIKTNDSKLLYAKWTKTYQTQEELKLELLKNATNMTFLELCSSYGVNQVNTLKGLIKSIKDESNLSNRDTVKLLNKYKMFNGDLVELLERLFNNCANNLDKTSRACIRFDEIYQKYQDILTFYDDFSNN